MNEHHCINVRHLNDGATCLANITQQQSVVVIEEVKKKRQEYQFFLINVIQCWMSPGVEDCWSEIIHRDNFNIVSGAQRSDSRGLSRQGRAKNVTGPCVAWEIPWIPLSTVNPLWLQCT